MKDLGAVPARTSVVIFTAILLLGAVTQSARAQTFTILHNFGPFGANPAAGVVEDSAGNLYGTVPYGGDTLNYWGAVFKVDTNGDYSLVYNFNGPNGASPYAPVTLDKAGNLYGTTVGFSPVGDASGLVFKVDPNGNESVLYRFTGGADGASPMGGVIRDEAGNLYGTTQAGGAYNAGVVFKLSRAGRFTVLHSFAGAPSDGAYPAYTNLLMDCQRNLYGVAQLGGAYGRGVLYKLSKDGQYRVLHNFSWTDGSMPFGTPAMDWAGNLYGTTYEGGSSVYGTVWKVSPNGEETVLYNFTRGTDGGGPQGGVILDLLGNLYGSTLFGGTSDYGTLFKLTRKGTLTVLHSFAGAPSDGAYPNGELLGDAKGRLYGTTYAGGPDGPFGGTLWELTTCTDREWCVPFVAARIAK